MSERDELADILEATEGLDYAIVADLIVKSGYRKPRTITTAEELDALEEGSLILDSDPDVLVKRMGRWRSPDHPDNSFGPASIGFPVTVLYEPQP